MASNGTALSDGDGRFSDWIEISNPDPAAVDLSGWGLRDRAETWLFPPGTVVPGGGFLVVFASGQAVPDYVDGGGYLHTTFKLDADGEPLALVRPDGTVAFEYATVPKQREDLSYGVHTQRETLVVPETLARYLVPNAALPGDWRQSGYDDSSWIPGKAAVGYKTTPGPVIGGGVGSHTAYLVEADTPGNQEFNGSLGMDFEVLETISVTDLGVYDSGSDGLTRTITAQLWSRSGDSGVSVLRSETFSPASPGALEGGSRFKALATPITLAPGSYTMVAYGYGSGEPNANQGISAVDGLDIDTGEGAIQFVGGSRWGTAGSFPNNVDGGPSNRYGAGTFKFVPNGASDIETDVEAEMLNANASIFVRIPFAVTDPAATDTLQLDIGFDDGFVAWVNGEEIARRNSPAVPGHDSAATAEANGRGSFLASLLPGTLTATGNILAIQGLNISDGDDDFIVSPNLSGIANDVLSARFFVNPTPASSNDPAGVVGFVGDTSFSIDRGFYDAPFEVAITTPTENAEIRYTTDGSEPGESHGMVYGGPITISGTTILRAAAFKPDHAPSNVDTQSYLFLDEVAVRDNAPPGYPSSWGGIGADYAMDQNPSDYARAAGDASHTPSQARAAIVTSLKAIPTLSIVTDRDHLFDPSTGIYVNPSGRGSAWERPVSVELIDTDGTGRFQVDAGLRIMGFTSRNLSFTPKLNMRLLFKKEYGPGQLGYPVLGPEGPDKFNTLALRGNTRDTFIFGSQSYLEDEWAKRAQFALGQPAARGTFMHVYLNGIYWGLYNPTERPDDAFAETYLGGDKSEYDVVKFCCPDRHIAGSITMWDNLLAECRAGLADNASYYRIQGLNPDGIRNLAFPVLIDVDNFIDYVINGQYHASLDWPGNYYVIRDRVEGRSEGFKYFTWDNDLALSSGANKVQTSPGHNWWTESPGEMDIALRTNAEYRMRFADRVYKHYHHGGAMTVRENINRWNSLAAFVRPALFAESARWGDAKQSIRTVQDHWDPIHASRVNSYFPSRQATVFSQMRSHGLYPDIDAPEFNQHGGVVSQGFLLNFTSPATVHYTTDGSDPRLPGGAINPAASTGSTALGATTLIRARALDNGEWSALNEATFIVGVVPDSSSLVISELMYHPADPNGVAEFIEVTNISATETLDLTGVTFTSGVDFEFPFGFTLAPLERTVVVRDQSAFVALYGGGARVAGQFANSTALANGGEEIALVGFGGTEILNFSYSDQLPWPESPDGTGPSLVLIAPTSNPDPKQPDSWRPSTIVGGNPGGSDATVFSGDPVLDNDRDGLNAFLEYALGTSDAVPNDSAIEVSAAGEGAVSITFSRNLAADDVAVELQESDDLLSWIPAEAATRIAAVHGGAGTLVETWHLSMQGAARKFVRLEVGAR